jgi:cGMP-dependent protein kinase
MGICGMNRMAQSTKLKPVSSRQSQVEEHEKSVAPKINSTQEPENANKKISKQGSAVNMNNQFSQLNEALLEQSSEKKLKGKGRAVKKFNFREQAKFEETQTLENVKKVERSLTSSDVNFIKSILKKSTAFKDLLEEDYEEIIPNMFYCTAQEGDYIFKQSDPATCFFIIQEGRCEVEIDNAIKKTLNKGEMFGDLALLYNAPRSASIRAAENSEFWALDRFSFRAILDKISSQNFASNRSYLDRIKFFDAFSVQQKDNLASYIIIEKYFPGQSIVNKGDMANSYYVIKEGVVECWNNENFIRELNEGDSFGEQALFESSTRALTVKSKTRTTCIVLSRETLVSVLGGDIETIINKNSCLWAIERHEIFKQLNQLQKTKWINGAEIVKLSEPKEFGERLHMPWFVYIVLEGQISYGSKIYNKGEIFGIDFIFPKSNRQTILQEKLIAEKGKYAQISMKAFMEIIEGDLEATIKRNSTAIHKKNSEQARNFRESVESVNLEDLYFVKRLGEGQFGDVMLVSEPKSSDLFALKMILKTKIVEHMIERHVVNEKKVLEVLNFPFIMKLFKTFKDDKALYFLTSFIRGMEMFDMIRQVDLLDNEETRFYIGTLLLTLEYLHGLGIVYRDLKPENMIVDELGYLNLIDFGTAKKLKDCRNRTQTIIGTPHYMAPETLQGKGYSYPVDLWSLGIIMYEFMCGSVPFGEEETDPINIYNLISKSVLEYPTYFKIPQNEQSIAFINILLSRIPEARLNGDFSCLKTHSWFEEFNWDDLFDKKIEAPYIPSADHVISDSEIRKILTKKTKAIVEIEVS